MSEAVSSATPTAAAAASASSAAAVLPEHQLLSFAAEDDPVLHRPAATIPSPLSADDHLLVARMCHCIQPAQLAASGAAWPSAVGMAAPQWKHPRRAFLWCPSRRVDDPVALEVMLNASYEPVGSETDVAWEGCFSVPGRRGLVRRARHIRVSYDKPDGTHVAARDLSGWEARVFAHECDHTDGFLYTTAKRPQPGGDAGERVHICEEIKECTWEQLIAERAATAERAANERKAKVEAALKIGADSVAALS